MARVLLIDDDPGLLDLLALALQDAGHQVEPARDGLAGWARLAAAPAVEVVISDVNMPGLDGFALLRRVREAQPRLPFLLLTSRDSEIDEALGLELGADDYVSKPFSARVVVARVAALVRRSRAPADGPPDRLERGPLIIDRARLVLLWRGAEVETTLTELRLVELMASAPGVVWSRDRLLDALRGADTHVAPRLIDTYVRRLRRKLEAIDPAFDAIETVIGAGYRWRGTP